MVAMARAAKEAFAAREAKAEIDAGEGEELAAGEVDEEEAAAPGNARARRRAAGNWRSRDISRRGRGRWREKELGGGSFSP